MTQLTDLIDSIEEENLDFNTALRRYQKALTAAKDVMTTLEKSKQKLTLLQEDTDKLLASSSGS